MALVLGEDSESDEEINTDQIHSLVLTPDGSLTGYQGPIKGLPSQQQKTAGIVMGEGSETDEEEEAERKLIDEPDGGGGSEQKNAPFESSQRNPSEGPHQDDPSRENAIDSILPPPKSLLHKKLRERNQILRRNIMERIIKLYRTTCRNLTVVNNNLSKAQGTIETINSNLKRSEHELSELNSIIQDINETGRTLAPCLNIQPTSAPRKSPSPMRSRQQLIKGISSQVYNFLGPSRTVASNSKVPQDQPKGQGSGLQGPGGQGSAARAPPEAERPLVDEKLKIPEAKPGPGTL